MSEKATMQVNIVCAEHPVWSGEALQVTIPASGGQMGILPNHEPVLTLIKQGKLAVAKSKLRTDSSPSIRTSSPLRSKMPVR